VKETPQPPLDPPYATLVDILGKAIMGTRNWDLPDQPLDRDDYCGNPVSTCYTGTAQRLGGRELARVI
jgi:hypothetical protein